jgi:ribosomal protein S24E
MNIDILSKKPEVLLKRNYFEAKLVFEGKTPSRLDIVKDLSHKLGSKSELTAVRKIMTDYGSERAIVSGYYYDDEATFSKLENRFVKLRHLPKAEQTAEKEKIKAAKQAAKAK